MIGEWSPTNRLLSLEKAGRATTTLVTDCLRINPKKLKLY